MIPDPSPAPTLPMSQKILYVLGYLPDTISINRLGVLAMIINNVEQKFPFIWIHLAIPRLWETVTTPIIGSLSARTRRYPNDLLLDASPYQSDLPVRSSATIACLRR